MFLKLLYIHFMRPLSVLGSIFINLNRKHIGLNKVMMLLYKCLRGWKEKEAKREWAQVLF